MLETFSPAYKGVFLLVHSSFSAPPPLSDVRLVLSESGPHHFGSGLSLQNMLVFGVVDVV